MTSGEYITLKEYFEVRIAELEKASCLAAGTLEKRLEGMNEFREALKDQNATFIPRSEYQLAHEKIKDDIKMLRESKAMLEGRASQTSVNIATLISIVGLILAAVALLK